MARPALVLFDLDGVLVHYRHVARLQRLAERTGAELDAVSQALFGSGLETRADLGDCSTQDVVDELRQRLGAPVTLDDCLDARAAAMNVDADMLALAAQVARRARVAILTNNGLMLRDHLPRLCPPLFPLFAGTVHCSAQYRRGKPDPQVFLDCARDLGVAPGAVYFIDDKPLNAEGARRAGMAAHAFRDAAGLRADLERLDLLEPTHDTH
ncbi:HAD family hydrolase [Arenimonas sp. MALMAid1274]|uniref:HAD family hydrolase n=1 Tax=Arenimonas sp. MALMAid1274 TaxID=3411630 RepID=UPI003BA1A2FB